MILRILLGAWYFFFYKVFFLEFCWQIVGHGNFKVVVVVEQCTPAERWGVTVTTKLHFLWL
jgi:hypothetical protein